MRDTLRHLAQFIFALVLVLPGASIAAASIPGGAVDGPYVESETSAVYSLAEADDDDASSEADESDEAGESEEELRERARASFARGRQAYVNQNYEEAIGHWERAMEILPNDRLLLYIGQAHANRDNFREALRYYRRFAQSSTAAGVEIADELALMERQAHDNALLEARRAVDGAAARASGSQPTPRALQRYEMGTAMRDVPVRIVTSPPGATVYVDDKELGPLGQTPLSTRLFTGNHLIIVEREFHQPMRQLVPVAPIRTGESVPEIRFDMEKVQVPVRVSVDPITATVTFIGEGGLRRDLGIGGWEGELPAGPATFVVQQGGQDRRVEAVLRADADVEVRDVVLYLDESREGRQRLELGTLRVDSELMDGEIFVNGRRVGRAPGEFVEEVTAGTHLVEVRNPGYRTWSRSVNVSSQREVTIVTPTELERVRAPSIVPGVLMMTVGAGAAGTGAYFLATADEGSSEADIGLIGVIAGGALLTGGIIWTAVAGSNRAKANRSADSGWRFYATPVPDGAMGFIGGRF